jgi:hypothetical protein
LIPDVSRNARTEQGSKAQQRIVQTNLIAEECLTILQVLFLFVILSPMPLGYLSDSLTSSLDSWLHPFWALGVHVGPFNPNTLPWPMCAVLSVGGVVLTLQLDVADLATVYNMC